MSVNPKGITTLIVFVHGFTGHPETTWTLKNAKQGLSSDQRVTPEPSEPSGGASMPSTTQHKSTFDLITKGNSGHEKRSFKIPRLNMDRGRPSQEIQEHKGYDTKIRHSFVGPASQNNVADHGWDLLCALEEVRRDNPSRPLLFIAHSFGGLITKIALVKSRETEHMKQHLHHIMTATVGILFFGTPHRGADPLGPGLRRVLVALADGFSFNLNSSITETLMPGCEYLREIRDSFLGLATKSNWTIYSFQKEYGGTYAQVVEDESSRLDEPRIETTRHISSNHMDMVRFTGIGDNEYIKVKSAIDIVTNKLRSTRRADKDSGAETGFKIGQDMDSAMDLELPVPQEKFQPEAREDLKRLLYFDEIDARLLNLKPAYKTTCQWILKKDKYIEWLSAERLNDHHGFLWIKGKPGARKSILMKYLTDDAGKTTTTNKEILVIWFFFNARGEELERSTLGLYRKSWQIELLKKTLVSAVEYLKRDWELRLFVDAPDECSDTKVADTVSFSEELGERAVEHNTNLRICFSSRYYPTITVKKGKEIRLNEEEEHSLNIVRYINSQLKLGTFGKSKKADELRNNILEKSAGIFLWVALVIPMLNKDCFGGDVHGFKRRLNEIPPGLHNLFEMIVARDEEDLDKLRLCIQWVLFAIRPLKTKEYFFSLREFNETTTMSSWEHEHKQSITQEDLHQFVISSSKGFAESTKTRSTTKGPTVQFIHESVRDYFLSKTSYGLKKLWPRDNGQTFTVFSHNVLKKRCCEEIARRGQYYIPSVIPVSSILPSAQSKDSKKLRQLVLADSPFLDRGAKLELLNRTGITPLYQAATAGKEDMVQLLLEKGVEINTKDFQKGTPLHRAAEAGREDIVKLLSD
ncbi:Ankyrin-2 [Cytospora mali]|uniref:Ankyrin-2 n=1 Tax=Cytospora mali TaxID=578113 RepID=A0A194W3B5_CYTMA|nr:Ankyrin-2 [Valsa mali]